MDLFRILFFHVETDSYFPGRDFHLSKHTRIEWRIPFNRYGATSGVGFTEKMYQIASDKKDIF
jgi:hypothetical protein